ncbi:MAG TPA: GTPase HflX, partial [Paracoccaceae bacterium]|nr:GTPase HflX [Paracoccaceae bacterium]
MRKEPGANPAPALEEACGLAAALSALELVGHEIVPLPRPRPGLLFGDGKVAELGAKFAELAVTLVIVNGSVTPVQQRNLERAWKVKLLDRTGL